MKAMVAIKRVIDHNVNIRLKPDGTGVDAENVKMSIDPFCEIAVEEAVRLKEAGVVNEILTVTVGMEAAKEQLQTALALGATRALLIKTNADTTAPQPLQIAQCLAAVARAEQADILLFGKQSIDGDNNQTGQMTAALLDAPQATFASEVKIDGDKLTVTRETDGGLQTIALTKPCVITVDLRLNNPRYPKLPNIMKAKKTPIEITTPEDLGINIATNAESDLTILNIAPPPERSKGIAVGSVDELIVALQNKGLL